MDIVVWLRSLSLGKYEAIFRENEIDETVLPDVTADDLKDLGVSIVGHRRVAIVTRSNLAPLCPISVRRGRKGERARLSSNVGNALRWPYRNHQIVLT
jgi:SAM domain (Sterile alpha motif)